MAPENECYGHVDLAEPLEDPVTVTMFQDQGGGVNECSERIFGMCRLTMPKYSLVGKECRPNFSGKQPDQEVKEPQTRSRYWPFIR